MVFTPIEPSVSGHDYSLLLGYAESSMRGGIERLRAHAEVSHGPPPGDLPASATAHQTLLSQVSSFSVPFPVSRRTRDLPLASLAVASAAQWGNLPA